MRNPNIYWSIPKIELVVEFLHFMQAGLFSNET